MGGPIPDIQTILRSRQLYTLFVNLNARGARYLKESNVTNIPTLTYTIISACEFCLLTAQVVQADLAALNITVNIRS